jgi:hypothetical protein
MRISTLRRCCLRLATLLPYPQEDLGQWLCVPPFRSGLPFSGVFLCISLKERPTGLYIYAKKVPIKVKGNGLPIPPAIPVGRARPDIHGAATLPRLPQRLLPGGNNLGNPFPRSVYKGRKEGGCLHALAVWCSRYPCRPRPRKPIAGGCSVNLRLDFQVPMLHNKNRLLFG